jgi:hypothetical protein
MHFTDEFVTKLEGQVKMPKETYAEVQAKNIVKMLKSDRRWYKEFGVYWWAVKDAIRKYAGGGKAWYCGSFDDPLMKERAWHGSEFRTFLAGMYLMSAKKINDFSGYCQWTDKEGVTHDYVVYDDDALV